MPTWTVTRAGGGLHAQLYSGRLRTRAFSTYYAAVARPLDGTVVTLTRIADGERTVLRKSDDITVLVCSRCQQGIEGDEADYVPAKDFKTGQDVCGACSRAERHIRRAIA